MAAGDHSALPLPCSNCGYDLRGTVDVESATNATCPECGAQLDIDQLRERLRLRRGGMARRLHLLLAAGYGVVLGAYCALVARPDVSRTFVLLALCGAALSLNVGAAWRIARCRASWWDRFDGMLFWWTMLNILTFAAALGGLLIAWWVAVVTLRLLS